MVSPVDKSAVSTTVLLHKYVDLAGSCTCFESEQKNNATYLKSFSLYLKTAVSRMHSDEVMYQFVAINICRLSLCCSYTQVTCKPNKLTDCC